MNQHAEHLQLLTIFHYVVAGLAALFSFFPLLYSLVGGFLLYAAHHPVRITRNLRRRSLGGSLLRSVWFSSWQASPWRFAF
ncbi:MAG TPA: hypothetical protein VKD89_00685 [Candidatus Udaeobacter sp.]|nr:hypothetical protein [Candidatus Udaeobacter sp.]